MTTWVALLRAVNVGGTGMLPMATLRALCTEAGFDDVRTYIASGNVVLRSALPAREVKTLLEEALAAHMGRPVTVIVRSADELATVQARNPFVEAPGNRVVAVFLDAPPPADAVANAKNVQNERIATGAREIYIDYADGMAASKLSVPAARAGTARNMNTVARLVAMAAE